MKSTLTTTGILTHRLPFSDTSLIVTWITPEVGLIKTMAKGALRPRSPLAASLDLFYLCEITCALSSASDLGTLKEARLLSPHLALRRDWRVIQCAHYFTQLLAYLTEPSAEIREFFEIYQKALTYLESHPPNKTLVFRYEKKLLELSGLPTEIPQALERGLATHHHRIPVLREKVLEHLPS